ncbi:hypothetical protein QYE76_000559 [Lolium multiflorum]|uniref:Integrase zinc-binding domain-containing protein n=1 Tax=Lolium multiflorum TaxID=4521 RepID=A0AAD8RJK5_LOLMU|nr:hypothetical protein QYE76_000559 [Lolium multiflorum]
MIINEDNEYELEMMLILMLRRDDDYVLMVKMHTIDARTIVVSRALNVLPSASTQRCNLFQTKALVGPDKACKVIIDGGSRNLASKELCTKLKLKYLPHPHPYYIWWLSDNGEMKESHAGGLMGHFGREKTLLMLADHFYWPKMRRDVDVSRGDSIARGGEEQLDMKTNVKMDVKWTWSLDMKISWTRRRRHAREEKKASGSSTSPPAADANPAIDPAGAKPDAIYHRMKTEILAISDRATPYHFVPDASPGLASLDRRFVFIGFVDIFIGIAYYSSTASPPSSSMLGWQNQSMPSSPTCAGSANYGCTSSRARNASTGIDHLHDASRVSVPLAHHLACGYIDTGTGHDIDHGNPSRAPSTKVVAPTLSATSTSAQRAITSHEHLSFFYSPSIRDATSSYLRLLSSLTVRDATVVHATSIVPAIAHTIDTSAPTLTIARNRITMGKKKHDSEAAMAEGQKFNLPATMTDEEIKRLGVLGSKVDRPVQPPLPRYATDIMPPGLTEEEALERANSTP